MSTLASTIINYARVILQDQGTVERWEDEELLGWLNLGQDQVVALKPDAGFVITSFKLVGGKTQQNLPDGSDTYKDPTGATQMKGIQLLDITRNMGINGTTPGKSISIMDRVLLDQVSPSWHYSELSTVIEHYIYSEKYPTSFFVCPVPLASQNIWVELIYVAKPTQVANVNSYISLADEYTSILLDYILFRAYSKSTDSVVHLNKALMYYQAFSAALGSKVTTEFATDPNNLTNTPSVSLRRV